ncbi:MAG: SDR family NAD(P)-dependent oxidoreductase [Gammaproteobacteria bacterium]|nr:SDR family NAD(P)-dependent oxidoreductase [Gammaproteobacteria bacterium]
MQKTILITGSTDGIGLETAKILIDQGHHVLLHGRNPEKLDAIVNKCSSLLNGGSIEHYVSDLSRLTDVETLAKAVIKKHDKLDVLINNAGVLKTPETFTQNGLDVRFVVNTIAPYLLTQRLLTVLGTSGRVVNLSSAAQSPVDIKALTGERRLRDMEAYSQSKLAITMWSLRLGHSCKDKGPSIIAVNPGSLLATKMVKEGFGVAGHDIRMGVDILIRVALSDDFETASGKYFDNDSGQFVSPHPDALDQKKSQEVIRAIEAVIAERMF